ncbi:MAG: hypothetical protein ACRDTE_23595 [Pseudonocardiaceae bacterium]
MSESRVPLTGRSLRFAAGMFQDMARTRDAAACAREASAARAAAATSRNPLLCLSRAAWWAAVADRRAAPDVHAASAVSTGAADRHQRVAGPAGMSDRG